MNILNDHSFYYLQRLGIADPAGVVKLINPITSRPPRGQTEKIKKFPNLVTQLSVIQARSSDVLPENGTDPGGLSQPDPVQSRITAGNQLVGDLS